MDVSSGEKEKYLDCNNQKQPVDIDTVYMFSYKNIEEQQIPVDK
jgi:hypothetical protein